MSQLLITHARIFDGTSADCAEDMNLLVADGLIQQISAQPIAAPNARLIDAGGRTLMPGLIDCHVHAFASDVSMQKVEALGEAYRTAHAVRMLQHALHCGFTTVRDIGGGNYSLYRALADRLFASGHAISGRQLGFAPQSQEKADYAWKSAISGLDIMRSAGVKLCYGTDLLGSLYRHECREFTLRAEVYTPLELLRQATSIAAEMMMQAGQLGCVAEGAHADLIVVDGDPLADIGLVAADGARLSVIVRGGEVVKDVLAG